MNDGIFYAKAAAFIGAAIAMSIGSVGPSIGQGLVGMKACENIGKYPASASTVQRVMIIAMGIIESSSVYNLIIAGALIVVSVIYL